MKLTKLQISVLKDIRRYRSPKPTLLVLVKCHWFGWGLLLFVVAIGIAVIKDGGSELGYAITGVGVGIVLRDILAIVYVRSLWPVKSVIIDWPAVEKLLTENSHSD